MNKNFTLLGISLLLLFGCKKNDIMSPVQSETTQNISDLNEVHACATATPLQKDGDHVSSVGLVETFWAWPNNVNGPTVLRVKFLNVDEYVRAKVKYYAKQWEQCANVRFDFVNSDQPAEIRVSNMYGGGTWAKVGKTSLELSNNQPTMNFSWLNQYTTESEFSAVILHQFGHALGLIDEQVHPQANLQWNKPYIYEYYRRTAGWTKDVVDQTIFYNYPDYKIAYSNYDPYSVMHLPVPSQFTFNGFTLGWNTQLSATDRAFIQKLYPFQGKPDPSVCKNERTIYAILGSQYYVNNTIINNTLEVRTNDAKEIILYQTLPDQPLDSQNYNLYYIVDDSGRQYAFTSKTLFGAKTLTDLTWPVRIFKNGMLIPSKH